MKKIAGILSQYYITRKLIDETEKEIYVYCFEVMLSTIVNLMMVLVIALYTKAYFEGLVYIFVFALFQIVGVVVNRSKRISYNIKNIGERKLKWQTQKE